MKKIFIFMIGLLFAASAAFASPNAKVEFATMSKADTQMLFGSDSVSAVALSSDEMKVTAGEFWPVIGALATGWTFGNLNAPTWNRPSYGYSRSYVYRHPYYYRYGGYYTYSYNRNYWTY